MLDIDLDSLQTTHLMVLSYGRSGSTLLVHNLAKNLQVAPKFLETPKELPETIASQTEVYHSHLLMPKIPGLQRVFNLRKNSKNTILSFLLASNFNYYHNWKDPIYNSQTKEIKPIRVSLNSVKMQISKLIDWHNYYSKSLNENDLVVTYEKMLRNINPDNQVYHKTYPNKKFLIKNFAEVVEYIDTFNDQLSQSTMPFLKHKNSIDIYQFIELQQ